MKSSATQGWQPTLGTRDSGLGSQGVRRQGAGKGWAALFALLLTGGLVAQQDPAFRDVTDAAGISFEHHNSATPQKYLVETMGSGCAFIDFDGDGYLDIFLVNGGPTPGGDASLSYDHALYRNRRDGRFELVTSRAGISPNRYYGMGVAVGDFQNDGHDDLFITNFNGPNVLYENNGDGTFTDVTQAAGVGGDGRWSTSAAFFDYDNDGLLDLYVVRYVDHSFDKNLFCGLRERGIRAYCTPQAYAGVPDLLYRNNGKGTFTDVSEQAGIALAEGKGLGVTLLDYDGDGYTDVYVANDSVRNFLFRNDQNGGFEERGLVSGTAMDAHGQPQAGMGTVAGDYDGDGNTDLAVTNLDLEYLALYRNLGDGFFDDVSSRTGVQIASSDFVGFGLGMLDFDNDSDLDMFVANGNVLDNAPLIREGATYRQRKLLLENRQGRFTDVAPGIPALEQPQVSRGLALGDYDNDGDVDVLISNCGGPAVLFRNERGQRRPWLQLKLVGETSNRNGIGAHVEVRAGPLRIVRQAYAGGSYLSSSDLRIHVGLADEATSADVSVSWPSGKRTVLENVATRQVLTVREAPERQRGSERARASRSNVGQMKGGSTG